MQLTHTTQFYSLILLPEKYDLMTFDDVSTNLNFSCTFKNGAIAFVPIYSGEILRGAKLPQLDVLGMTFSYQSSWIQRETATTYRVTLPLEGVMVIHNNTSNNCSIQEHHTDSTTSFN